MKKIKLLIGLLFFSVSMFAQNLPSGAIWGGTKLKATTSAGDSSGYMSLDQIKSFTNTGVGSGTVTSVAVTVPTGLSVSGSPVTSSGTIAISNNLSAGYVSSSGVGGSLTSSSTIPGSAISGNISGNAAGLSATLGVATGGTGATTLTGYVKGNGTSAMTASSTIPTTDLSGTVSNAQLANSAITINGTSTSLGGTRTIDLASVTAQGATTATATTYSGGLTSSGAFSASAGTTLAGNLVETPSSVTTATSLTTSSNRYQFVDATSAAVTITLPTTPANGTVFTIVKTNSTTNYVTVTRGGTNTIQGNTSHVIVSSNKPTSFRFNTATWYVED